MNDECALRIKWKYHMPTATFTRLNILLLLMLSVKAYSYDIGLKGQVKINGSVVAKACDISMNDAYQAIEMADESVNTLKRRGMGRNNPFSIDLINCSLDVDSGNNNFLQYLDITFDGGNSDNLYKINGSTEGLALEVANVSGEKATPGKPMSKIVMDNKNIHLDYNLRLKSISNDIMPGTYSTIIKYKVNYF